MSQEKLTTDHYFVVAFRDEDFRKMMNQIQRYENQRLHQVKLNLERKKKAEEEGKVVKSRNRKSKPIKFEVLGEYYGANWVPVNATDL
jgi:predicted SprT family Zn-dependent metalloprotease